MESDSDIRAIGTRVQAARKLAGMNQAQASAALGIGRRTLVRMENGETRAVLGILPKIASLFDVEVDDLRAPQLAGTLQLGDELKREMRAVRRALLDLTDTVAGLKESLKEIAGRECKCEASPKGIQE